MVFWLNQDMRECLQATGKVGGPLRSSSDQLRVKPVPSVELMCQGGCSLSQGWYRVAQECFWNGQKQVLYQFKLYYISLYVQSKSVSRCSHVIKIEIREHKPDFLFFFWVQMILSQKPMMLFLDFKAMWHVITYFRAQNSPTTSTCKSSPPKI